MDTENIVPVEAPAFELRKAGIKGLGLFATRNIEPGERLIQETPLFSLPKKDIMNAAIIESFINLRPEQRAAYLDLSFHDTCRLNQETEAGETAGKGRSTSTNVEDPATPDDGTENPAQHDCCSCASDMRHLPPKTLDSRLEIENSCKLPNPDSSSGDHNLKEKCRLELPEHGDTTPKSLVYEPRVDSPVQGSDETTKVWDVADLTEALEVKTTDSDLKSGVPNSNSDGIQVYGTDQCEMTDSLAAQVINIWRTNSYMLDNGIDLDYAGIGLMAARLNHSCAPNVHTAYNSKSGHITVQAIQPIAAGDELCTAYINGAGEMRSERRAQLYMWGFECTCIACADGRDESRRRDINSLKAKVDEVRVKLVNDPMNLTVAQLEQTVGDLLDLATLMSDEGLLGPDLADL